MARMEKRSVVYRVLVGNLSVRDQVGEPEYNIKIGLQEVEWGGWTGSSWHRIGTGGGHL